MHTEDVSKINQGGIATEEENPSKLFNILMKFIQSDVW